MRPNSFFMLVLALVFGGVAVVIANKWVAMQSQRASQPISQLAAVETATIVVAANALPFGTTIKGEDLREIPWARSALPEGAFSKIAEIIEKGRRVVLSPLGPNEPILKWKITGPDARASLSAVVEEGMRAVGIRVNDVVGVAGFVLPGDRVDVLLTRTDNSEKPSTDVIIQNVRVLAVDQVADEKASTPTLARVVTVEVTTVDAQKVALAQSVGQLSLSLRSAGSLDKAEARRIVADELTSSPSVYEAEFSARQAAQEALDQRLKGLEGNLAQLAKNVEATGSKAEEALKQQISAIRSELEKKLKGSGKDDAVLRARLGELEAQLRALGKPQKASLMAVEQAAAKEVVDESLTVNVIRGMKEQSYTVPRDAVTRW
jgi:pilus assembly protein CpaB